ncbi:MAG: hypothetical protein HY738_13540 [Bacteroidia bacterium]|nr:hypothetical protein [Bacteroidia bacterium]
MNHEIKTGFIILCRYNSTRLPGKILLEIYGKPVLQYIVERLAKVISIQDIVIATSSDPSDDPIHNFCRGKKYNCFRGSLNNVALRFLNCAKEYQFDFAARINGDNLFVDIETTKKMHQIALTGKYDFISNVKNRTFPKGMSIEFLRASYFEQIIKEFPTDEYFEHVTLYLYHNDTGKNYCYFYNDICPDAGGFQLAIDDKSDFELASKIIGKFKKNHTEYGLIEIYNIIKHL